VYQLQHSKEICPHEGGQPIFSSHSNSTTTQLPRFLDAEQAASFLGGLNSRTVTRWAREGYLPAYPIGEGKRRLWRFLVNDLEQWMFARKTGQYSYCAEATKGTLATATDAPTRGYIQ